MASDGVRGLGSGAKATTNGLAQAGYGAITLGLGETAGPFELNSWDLANGAGYSQQIANASGNILIGAAGGAAGCMGGKIGNAAKVYDLASNLSEFGQGVASGNATQIICSGLGLAPNVLSKCFTAGTQIVVETGLTDDGTMLYDTKNIEDIEVGDLVYSYDTATGEYSYNEVTDTFVRRSDHINYLTIEDENGNEQTIETTDGHPFWVVSDDPDLSRAASSYSDEMYHGELGVTENGYWVEAKDLHVGDVFLGADGKLSTLTNAVRIEQCGGIDVFNFTVEGNHNYFVLAKDFGYGQSCVLVHNALDYGDIARIQNAANELGLPIHVVGSRASGTARSLSDWDYVIEGAKSRQRGDARYLLPKGVAGGEISASGRETGIDIFTEPLNPDFPHISFFPQK